MLVYNGNSKLFYSIWQKLNSKTSILLSTKHISLRIFLRHTVKYGIFGLRQVYFNVVLILLLLDSKW